MASDLFITKENQDALLLGKISEKELAVAWHHFSDKQYYTLEIFDIDGEKGEKGQRKKIGGDFSEEITCFKSSNIEKSQQNKLRPIKDKVSILKH